MQIQRQPKSSEINHNIVHILCNKLHGFLFKLLQQGFKFMPKQTTNLKWSAVLWKEAECRSYILFSNLK